MRSPLIQDCTWGKTVVQGHVYRDVLLYPGGVEEWDWNKSNTHHNPGIMAVDVEHLLKYKPTYLIFSQGFHNRLNVDFETYKLLLRTPIDFLITQTDNAVREYNIKVSEGCMVAALIHSTC